MKNLLLIRNMLCVSMFFCLWGIAVNAQNIPLVYSVENSGVSYPAPSLPPANESPSVVLLPNPFEWSDGHGVINTLEDWPCRRNEIKLEIEKYEIGFRPARPTSITAALTRDSVYTIQEPNWLNIDQSDPKWRLNANNFIPVEHKDHFLLVTIVENGKTLTLSSTINIPDGAGPFPAVIGVSGATGSLPASLFANCIQINYNPSQVGIDGKPNTGAFYDLYGIQGGHYAAWSWGASRIIDGLELIQSQINIDLAHIAITGCSRYGKLALFGGAFDERIALTIAQEPGGGGAAAWRVSEAIGKVEKIDNTDYSWFLPSMKDNFAGKTDRLPHDHHELIAMIAPRAVLILGNATIEWLADPSGYVSAMAAREVWKKFGVEDRIGFDFMGDHNHCNAPASQVDAADKFIKRFLYGETTDTNILTSPFQDVNYQSWIKDWRITPASFVGNN
ncbi:glucuronyl esterase domain-containing protein [Dysgonomonas macrotermitis]|uniref:4-O-methyl-glucuronoyl methylesterase-like domain-containing protein n=1 Tax=Dysgonomonas macrotermitis TaxID=1346286 RepID=A0A1M5JHC3_9BACT|nr:hypothetical protein [Dysgonomonas macrotermitis]SHG39952.1 hypothetical protein SAMN05444362_12410 [Dysgonomonas macrotermitis]